jgi:hypothetical protein
LALLAGPPEPDGRASVPVHHATGLSRTRSGGVIDCDEFVLRVQTFCNGVSVAEAFLTVTNHVAAYYRLPVAQELAADMARHDIG